MDHAFFPFLDTWVRTDEPRWHPPHTSRKTPSRISDMSVGDVRHCFSQIRSTTMLSSSTILWCGMTAGEFALQYLTQNMVTTRKKKRTLKA
jgi:hypothetical protein